MNLLSNPELWRNYRSQLRPGRMAATAGIIAALSLTFGYAFYKGAEDTSPAGAWGQQLFEAAFWVQVLALAVGGGFACLIAISREKEQNTFDFQRVTRLSPLELTLGKLFGAPVLSYFVVLCLMPAALLGAAVGRMDFTRVLAAYGVFLVCTVAWHGLALLTSLLMERNAASAGGLLYLALLGMMSIPDSGPLGLGMMSPFFSISMLSAPAATAIPSQPIVFGSRYWDSFFGIPIQHGMVLVVLSVIFLGWLLLALARNIKRDPSVYELYTPEQSLGLAAYLNLVLVGFFNSKQYGAHDAHQLMTFLNLSLFFGLGLTVMRNRDRLRRRISELGSRASGWLAAFWPATYLLGGFLGIGLAILGVISVQFGDPQGWNLAAGMVGLLIASFWLARDVLFLQWMNLTRVRRPLTMGMLYLIAYYTCMGILLGALGLYETAGETPFAAIFLPALGMVLEGKDWEAHRAAWMLAVAAQVPILCVLAMLQKQKLQELSSRPAGSVVAAVSAD